MTEPLYRLVIRPVRGSALLSTATQAVGTRRDRAVTENGRSLRLKQDQGDSPWLLRYRTPSEDS